MKERPLMSHVCTSNPMIPNEYHMSTNNAAIRMRTVFTIACKDTNLCRQCKKITFVINFDLKYVTLKIKYNSKTT